MGQITTRAIMLNVDLKYNEKGGLFQGYGQVTWLEHTSMVPPTCHVTRMIQKKIWKKRTKKKVTMASAKWCCMPLQLQGPSLEKRPSIMEYDLVLLHERNVEKHMIKKVVWL